MPILYLRISEVLCNIGQHKIIWEVKLREISELGIVKHIVVPSNDAPTSKSRVIHILSLHIVIQLLPGFHLCLQRIAFQSCAVRALSCVIDGQASNFTDVLRQRSKTIRNACVPLPLLNIDELQLGLKRVRPTLLHSLGDGVFRLAVRKSPSLQRSEKAREVFAFLATRVPEQEKGGLKDLTKKMACLALEKTTVAFLVAFSTSNLALAVSTR